MSQSIHMPSRRDCSVITSANCGDALLAALGELREPVLLDLALRVEPERLLDLDLDPEPLAVEAVLVALVEAAQRLVALEDVLERPAPAWWAPIGLFAVIGPSTKLKRGPPRFCSRSWSKIRLGVPPREDLLLERRVIRILRQRRERHGVDSRRGGKHSCVPERSHLGMTDGLARKEPMATAVTEQSFEQEVLQSDKPVIVDFWAEWCGPCHAVAPVLDRIVEESNGEIKLVKVNIDEEQELSQRYGVQSIPMMILFKDGEPAAAAVGAQPKPALERALGLTGSEG